MIKLKSFAKINLNIHLLPKKLKNGLYPLKYINCQINLFDEIFIEKAKNSITLTTKDKTLPERDQNLIYKAAVLLKKEAKNNGLGVKIKLIKNIPIKAGFGGGSSNAASVLLSLIKIWNLKISKEQVLKIANTLGKEVFYFLKGGVCEVLHDGSVVNKIYSNMPRFWLLLVSPKKKKPSTGYMFRNIRSSNIGTAHFKFDRLKQAIANRDKLSIINSLHNDFESFAQKKYPEILKIKKDFKENGALNSIMTGAGLYVVGFFDKKQTAEKAYNILRKSYKSAILSHTI